MYSEPGSNRYGHYCPQDFKSGVSTYSTIRATWSLKRRCKCTTFNLKIQNFSHLYYKSSSQVGDDRDDRDDGDGSDNLSVDSDERDQRDQRDLRDQRDGSDLSVDSDDRDERDQRDQRDQRDDSDLSVERRRKGQKRRKGPKRRKGRKGRNDKYEHAYQMQFVPSSICPLVCSMGRRLPILVVQMSQYHRGRGSVTRCDKCDKV